jgi:hypothetical protein
MARTAENIVWIARMTKRATIDLLFAAAAVVLFVALFRPFGAPSDAAVPSEPIPPLATLKRDLPPHAVAGCHQDLEGAELLHCAVGNVNSEKSIAIFGDSHAGHWVSTLDEIGKSGDWKIIPFTKAACSFARHDVYVRQKPYPSCAQWRESVIAEILRVQPDIVITTQSFGYPEAGKENIVAGMRDVWREFIAAGIPVVAIEDTPRMSFDPGDCLSKKEASGCFTPVAKARVSDNIKVASSIVPGVTYINMMDMICAPHACEAVVGNVIVWRDRHHLTNTYARTLAPYLAERIGILMDNVNS